MQRLPEAAPIIDDALRLKRRINVILGNAAARVKIITEPPRRVTQRYLLGKVRRIDRDVLALLPGRILISCPEHVRGLPHANQELSQWENSKRQDKTL